MVDGGAEYATTRRLPPRHGLTVVLTFPKGLVAAPSTLERAGWFVQAFPEFGTSVVMNIVNEIGALPTRNFQDGRFEGAVKITGATMRDTILKDRGGCYACPIRCKRVVEVNDAEPKSTM